MTEIDCPVCYEKIQSEEELTILKCGHKYHYHCIFNSFKMNHSGYENKRRQCPYCRVESDYLELKPGLIPRRQIHEEYNDLKGKNIKLEQLEAFLLPDKCQAIIMAGINKFNQCTRKQLDKKYCKLHKNYNGSKKIYLPM
jgi:hypothetical protein